MAHAQSVRLTLQSCSNLGRVEMTILQTRVSILTRLVGAASDEQTRFYLRGVNAREIRGVGGIILEATNGHLLACEHDDTGFISTGSDHTSFIVSAETIKAIKAAAKPCAKQFKIDPELLRVEIHNKSFKFCNHIEDGRLIYFPEMPLLNDAFVAGTFPDCARVIPDLTHETLGTIDCFNYRLLSTLLATAPSEECGFIVFQREQGMPMMVRKNGADSWCGVIMPMRSANAIRDPHPDWLYPRHTEKQKAA
jgi:hypothetical protein